MKLGFDISREYFVVGMFFVFVLLCSFVVFAYGGSDPSFMGHSSGEVEVTRIDSSNNSENVSLQRFVDDLTFSGSGKTVLNCTTVRFYRPTGLYSSSQTLAWCPSGFNATGGSCDTETQGSWPTNPYEKTYLRYSRNVGTGWLCDHYPGQILSPRNRYYWSEVKVRCCKAQP